jgi:NAD(P)-dependent dehydrogenase (short-subunit alcohol dehydrogenase family)
MALELAHYGIRVNALAPGLTRTDINRKDLEDETFLKSRLTRIPLGRVMAPEDLTGAAVFLASADSEMMTGMTLQVDGGRGIA